MGNLIERRTKAKILWFVGGKSLCPFGNISVYNIFNLLCTYKVFHGALSGMWSKLKNSKKCIFRSSVHCHYSVLETCVSTLGLVMHLGRLVLDESQRIKPCDACPI